MKARPFAVCVMVAGALLTTVCAPAGARLSPAVGATAAMPLSLPAPTTSTRASERKLPAEHFAIGTRDRLLTNGELAWTPRTHVPFDSVYQYASGSGPGTQGDAHVSTIVAFAKEAHRHHLLPVVSYFRMNGNAKGSAGAPAACTGTCMQGDTAKRNLDHLNDPTFMQPYFTGLVDTFRALDTLYSGQLVLHVEPDLSGYAQMLSNDRQRCSSDCVPGVGADDPAGVRAAVASSGITDLASFPNTYQGFSSAVLYLRDRYAPRVSLAYHVSGWATARTGVVTGRNDTRNNITLGRVPVDAAKLGARVARFATLSGATSTNRKRPGPTTSHYDVIFNDVLDNDAGYFATVLHAPGYWWDTENVDLPNFKRWETYVGAIAAAAKLPVTVWQVPIGNTIYRVENNTRGHYQDNRAEYFFGHLTELKKIGITGIIFGSSERSTWTADNQHDATDNTRSVCTTLGSHSRTRRCPTLSASVSDDDGGYIRNRARSYFEEPLRLR